MTCQPSFPDPVPGVHDRIQCCLSGDGVVHRYFEILGHPDATQLRLCRQIYLMQVLVGIYQDPFYLGGVGDVPGHHRCSDGRGGPGNLPRGRRPSGLILMVNHPIILSILEGTSLTGVSWEMIGGLKNNVMLKEYTFGPLFLAIWILLPSYGQAELKSTEYQIKAYRTSQAIEVDGELNEPDWQRAQRLYQFVQIEPDEGEPITQQTEVGVLYDDKYIYFGFICFDTDISQIVANEMRRDTREIGENDNVFVLLDTYNDRRSGFFFRVNPLGAMQDTALMNSGDSFNRDWDAVWQAGTAIHQDNWTAEIAIPFSQLRFNQNEAMTWGINVGREIRRNREDSTWVPVSKSYGSLAKYRTSNLGQLVGLEGIQPSRHLELLPYVLPGGSWTEQSDKRFEWVSDIGLDMKYGLTPNLTADLTLNTDFAQVEADQEQVNLTRFSLFFPEKRPFFLEGAGLFDFGIPRTSFRRPPPLLLFYSRRIGLAEGHAVPIITGGKITGKMGPYGLGLLNVLTDEIQSDDPDDTFNIPRMNYSVLRVKRDVFRRSSVGLIAVNQQETDKYNRAGGFDFIYRPTDNLDLQGMWARTFEKEMSEEEMSGQHDAWYLGSNWRNDRFRLESSYMDIGEDFNPAVGFVRRKGIRRIRGEMRYTPWPQRFGIRRIFAGPEFDYILDQNNELETRDITLSSWLQLEEAGWLSFQIQQAFERLDENFEIREGIVIPVDEYRFNTFRVSFSTDDSKKVYGDIRANFGDFFNGERNGFELKLNVRPNGHFSLESNYQFNRVTLPDGNFNANILSTRMVYSFSTRFFMKLFTQWNSDRNVINSNFLLNYIYRPGSDFFFVFNQVYEHNDSRTELIELTFVVKMTYWWNP